MRKQRAQSNQTHFMYSWILNENNLDQNYVQTIRISIDSTYATRLAYVASKVQALAFANELID